MIYIPTELTHDALLGSFVLIISLFVSIVFRQSRTVSIIIAKILVDFALKVLNIGSKWSEEHKKDIAQYTSDWHILKTKLKGGKIGKG